MTSDIALKSLIWLGSSRRDFMEFPEEVKSEMGYALFQAQAGGRHRKAKTFRGGGDAGVVEMIDDHRGDTYRTVYTVRFAAAVYVLHAFQKKSKSGISTPRSDLDIIDQRLRNAAKLHKELEK
jgi:phage-related protein